MNLHLLLRWTLVSAMLAGFLQPTTLSEDYQVVYRVPIPDMQLLRRRESEISKRIQDLEEDIRSLRANKSGRGGNKNTIREKSKKVLDLKDSLRSVKTEIRNPHVYLLCYNPIDEDALTILCDNSDLARRASKLSRGDFVRVRRGTSSTGEIRSFRRIPEPDVWKPLPLSMPFPLVVKPNQIRPSASIRTEGIDTFMISVFLYIDLEPHQARFVTVGIPTHYENMTCDVWLFDSLGAPRTRILDDMPLTSQSSSESWTPNQAIDPSQVELATNNLRGVVKYEVDWAQYHEERR